MDGKYDILSLVEFVESLQEKHITSENVMDINLIVDRLKAAPTRDTYLAVMSKKTKELLEEIGCSS